MSHLPRVAVVLLVHILLLGWFAIIQAGEREQSTRGFDPLRDSLARSEPQPIYDPNPKDAWNEVFFLLFTRTIASRVMADGAPVFGAGDSRLRRSSNSFAIDMATVARRSARLRC